MFKVTLKEIASMPIEERRWRGDDIDWNEPLN
jgi:hypothetical protein